MILVSRISLAYGISDKIMVLCGSALADAINQFKYGVISRHSYMQIRYYNACMHACMIHIVINWLRWLISIILLLVWNYTCRLMPFLILSGQLCPPGIEGTLFALFMSINNLGSTLGSFAGAALASFLNLSSGSFDNLLLGIAIQVFCTYIPVVLLFLIPKHATGIST